jgi:hypothetical protein
MAFALRLCMTFQDSFSPITRAFAVYALCSCLAIPAQARLSCRQAQTHDSVTIQLHELEEGFLNLILNHAPNEGFPVSRLMELKSVDELPKGKSLYVQLESHRENGFEHSYNRFVPSYRKTDSAQDVSLNPQTLMTSQGLYEKVDRFRIEPRETGTYIVLIIDQMTYERRLGSHSPDFRLAEAPRFEKTPVQNVSLRHKEKESRDQRGAKNYVRLEHWISRDKVEDLAALSYRLIANDEAATLYSDASTVRNGVTMVDPTINVSGGALNQGLGKLLFASAFQKHPEISQVRAILVWTNLDVALAKLIPKLQSEPQFQKPDASLPWQQQFVQCCSKIPNSVVSLHLSSAIEQTPFHRMLAPFGFSRLSETYLMNMDGVLHIGGTWDRVQKPTGLFHRLMNLIKSRPPTFL